MSRLFFFKKKSQFPVHCHCPSHFEYLSKESGFVRHRLNYRAVQWYIINYSILVTCIKTKAWLLSLFSTWSMTCSHFLTVFENHPKCLIWVFNFSIFHHFLPIRIDRLSKLRHNGTFLAFLTNFWLLCWQNWMRPFRWFSNFNLLTLDFGEVLLMYAKTCVSCPLENWEW